MTLISSPPADSPRSAKPTVALNVDNIPHDSNPSSPSIPAPSHGYMSSMPFRPRLNCAPYPPMSAGFVEDKSCDRGPPRGRQAEMLNEETSGFAWYDKIHGIRNRCQWVDERGIRCTSVFMQQEDLKEHEQAHNFKRDECMQIPEWMCHLPVPPPHSEREYANGNLVSQSNTRRSSAWLQQQSHPVSPRCSPSEKVY